MTPKTSNKANDQEKSNNDFQTSLKELSAIAQWFDSQEEADPEKGLEKVKQGVGLVKSLKKRLNEIENEFEEVKKQLDE